MAHLCEFVALLYDRSSLAEAGLIVPIEIEPSDLCEFEGSVAVDNELAGLLGDMVLSWLLERMMRGLWLLSYPACFVQVLGGDRWCKFFEKNFTKGKTCWKVFEDLEGKMPQEKDALDRHLFYTVPLKQIDAALSAHGGKATKHVQDLANKRSKAGIEASRGREWQDGALWREQGW